MSYKDPRVEFLLARIAEDEARGSNSHDRRAWHENGCSIHPQGLEETWCDCDAPARVLAECEAKRRIVELCRGELEENITLEFAWDDSAGYILEHLASVYADHPDYREEWKL